MSEVRRPINEVGPVDRSGSVNILASVIRTDNTTTSRQRVTIRHLTFRRAHEHVEHGRKPARHQAVLDWDRGDFGIRQSLRDEHDSQRQAGHEIIQRPSIVISGQPPDDGKFLDNIQCRRRRNSTYSLLTKSENSVPGDIGPDVVFDPLINLHDAAVLP